MSAASCDGTEALRIRSRSAPAAARERPARRGLYPARIRRDLCLDVNLNDINFHL